MQKKKKKKKNNKTKTKGLKLFNQILKKKIYRNFSYHPMASNSPPLVLSLLRKSMEWDGKKYEILDGFYRENWGRWESINGLERERMV